MNCIDEYLEIDTEEIFLLELPFEIKYCEGCAPLHWINIALIFFLKNCYFQYIIKGPV